MKWRERPEAVEALRKLAGRGWSSVDIAHEFEAEGVSKNSIIGACRRMGIALKYKPPEGRPRTSTKPRKRRKMTAPAQPPKPEPAPAPTPAPPRPCTILELENTSCRWILTDAAPWTYCGSPEADLTGGRSYCREHSRVAYGRRAV
jgi:GcrA cell cycle regulator